MGSRKIALYTHALAGGGAERAFAVLASGLAQRGHDVLFVTDYAAPENESFLDPLVRRIELGHGHLRATRNLMELLAREKPDVSISALGAGNVKHAAAATLAGRRRRAILTCHGFFASEPRPLSQLSFLLAPVLTRITGRTIAVSNALRENLIKSWRASPSRTCYVQNPVQQRTPREMPTEQSLRLRQPYILACGRLTPEKNFIGLLHAFGKMTRRDARLIILGEGEERSALEATVAKLGLSNRVELPGYVAEPWAYYETAACLAVSSRSESFGMVIVEALSQGLPVVATDCGGPREILNSPGIGRLVPIDDGAALTAGLDAALANPGDPNPRLARAETFSLKRGIDAYEKLIDEVVTENAVH